MNIVLEEDQSVVEFVSKTIELDGTFGWIWLEEDGRCLKIHADESLIIEIEDARTIKLIEEDKQLIEVLNKVRK